MAKAKTVKAPEPIEQQLWKAADKLRKNIDAAEYKHIVLGLIFLKYISDAFEELYQKLLSGEGEYDGADPEDKDEYKAENVFFVPEVARWSYLQNKAKEPTIGKTVDDAMDAIEKENPSLRNVLPKVFARGNLDPTNLGGLIAYSDFLLYYLYFLKPHLLSISEIGGTRRALTKGMIEELDIPSLPLPEQKAIAGVLSSLDDKIDLLHRQNKTLEAMAETLFRQWFIEEAEDDWEEGVLPDEFGFTMGQSPLGSSFNKKGIGIPIFQGNADFGFRFPQKRVFTTDPKRYAETNDTLISVRAPVDAQSMASERCCIGRGGLLSTTKVIIHSILTTNSCL